MKQATLDRIAKLEEKHAKKIELIKLEDEFVDQVGFGFISDTNTIYFTFKTLEDVKNHLLKYKSTCISYNIRHGNRTIDMQSQYEVSVSNHVQGNNKMLIEYNHFRLEFPASLLKDKLGTTTRKVTDCEYVHYTGMSESEIGKIEVLCYIFKSQVTYYGGYYKCVSAEEIQDIINYITA